MTPVYINLPVAQGNYAAAEPHFRKALIIYEKALGPEHPEVATSINNLAVLLKIQVRNSAVKNVFRDCLTAPAQGRAGPFWDTYSSGAWALTQYCVELH